MIEIKDVGKSFRGTVALKNINLSLPRGQIVGLFGENGAGKTTLIKSILGFYKHSGEILLDGQKISPRNIARISLATSEHSFFPDLTAMGHKLFYAEHFPKFSDKRFRSLMEFFELPEHKKLRSFSTGQKNQFEVIMSLCQGAEYILMDEPFAGNDIFNREDFYKVLLGIIEPEETILLSTHLIEEVSDIISRAILIRKGEIVGDINTLELADEGRKLIDYIKETYNYRPDRVSRSIGELAGGEDRT